MGRCCCCCCGNGNNTDTGKAIAGLATLEETIAIKENFDISIPMKNIIFDQGGFFTGDGKVYIPFDGIYAITAEIYYSYEANKGGTAWLLIRKNGKADYIAEGSTCPNLNSVGIAVTTSTVTKLNRGDYLEVIGSAAGNNNAVASITKDFCKISIARLGD